MLPLDVAVTDSTQPPAPPARGPVWPVFVAYAVAMVVFLGGSLVVFLLALAVLGATHAGASMEELVAVASGHPGVVVASLLVSVTTLLLVSLVAAKLERGRLRQRLRLHGSGRDIGLGLVATAIVVGTGQVMDSLAHLLGILRGSSLELLAGVVQSAHPAWLVVLVLLGSLGPGLAEELFFRGYAQTRLVERLGRWGGITIAAAMFGIIHMDLVHTPMAFLMGLVLGWVAERAGNIRACIVAHTLNNAASFLLLRFVPPQDMSATVHLALIPVGILLGVAGAAALWLATRGSGQRGSTGRPAASVGSQ